MSPIPAFVCVGAAAISAAFWKIPSVWYVKISPSALPTSVFV